MQENDGRPLAVILLTKTRPAPLFLGPSGLGALSVMA